MFEALKKYADFKGRARRKEYWLFILLYSICYFIAFLIDVASGALIIFTTIVALGLLIPFAVAQLVFYTSLPSGRLEHCQRGELSSTYWSIHKQTPSTFHSSTFFALSNSNHLNGCQKSE